MLTLEVRCALFIPSSSIGIQIFLLTVLQSYKIGDKVKVVSLPICLDNKDAPIGSEGIVVGTGNNPYYKVKSDSFTIFGKEKKEYWYFDEENLELVVEQTLKNCRELTPDTLIDISIDGNEFKVPLGDLIHAKALIGVANGLYGYSIFKALEKVFDKESVIINNHKYSHIHAVEAQDSLMKTYFIDKEKEAKKQALKEVIEKQREEIAKLEQQLIVLDDYDGCSL